MNGGTAGVLLAGLVLFVIMLVIGVSAMSKKPAPPPPPAVVAETPQPKTATTAAAPPAPEVVPLPAADPSPVEQWKKADVFVPAKTLFNAYTTGGNTIATDGKYKGKKLASTGTVVQVSTDTVGRGVLTLAAGDALPALEGLPVGGVVCLFDKRHAQELAALQPNHEVAIVGTCQGSLGFGVSVEHCRLLHAAPDAAALDRWIRGGSPAK